MWGIKAEITPVVIGALGFIKKGMEKYTEKIPGAININELQKITLLGTAHIPRKVLCQKQNLSALLRPRTIVRTRALRSVEQVLIS